MANDETTPKWITTRTQADIDNDTELAYITYTDLNRIGERINELMTMANYSSAPCETDWEKPEGRSKSTSVWQLRRWRCYDDV